MCYFWFSFPDSVAHRDSLTCLPPITCELAAPNLVFYSQHSVVALLKDFLLVLILYYFSLVNEPFYSLAFTKRIFCGGNSSKAGRKFSRSKRFDVIHPTREGKSHYDVNITQRKLEVHGILCVLLKCWVFNRIGRKFSNFYNQRKLRKYISYFTIF